MKNKKFVCVTYQSYSKFINCCDASNIQPDVINFDEAHHILGKEQAYKFDCPKFYFTATPSKNFEDDIIFTYTHYQGVQDSILNEYNIMVDFTSDNSIYKKMARAILKSGNNRVLTFHNDVNGSGDTSVKRFVNQAVFKKEFENVLNTEFPSSKHKYKNITFEGLYAESSNREETLHDFDNTFDNEIYILSSCRTIGEGVDTKNGNMCVFVDTKSSVSQIIQNIGRVTRKQSKPSTILLPVSVDKDLYSECETEEEKDKLIRNDLNQGGQYDMILNVLSALKQSDPELYELCLNYPNKFSNEEMKSNFEKQGVEFVKNVLSKDKFEEYVNSKKEDTKFEIHTNDPETPIRYEGKENAKKVEKYWEESLDDDKVQYRKMKGTAKKDVKPPQVKKHPVSFVGLDDDMKVLWNIKDSDNLLNQVCGYIESNISGVDSVEIQLEKTEKIAKWKHDNNKNPCEKSKDPIEKSYGKKLQHWKQALKGKGASKCYPEVRAYLDKHMPGWSDEQDLETQAMESAKKIVKWKQDHNKMPSHGSKDPIEKSYGKNYNIGNKH
eukprot:gene351-655_t